MFKSFMNKRIWILVLASCKQMGILLTLQRIWRKLVHDSDCTARYHENVIIREQTALLSSNFYAISEDIVSIIMPCLNTDPMQFHLAVRSVLRQTDPRWELIIVDDGSTYQPFLDEIAKVKTSSEKIMVLRRQLPGGISKSTNFGIEVAKGSYIGFLDHDDELSPDAIERVMNCIIQKQPSLIYSDEDKIDGCGQYCEPFYKPDWSPALLDCCNYVTHFSVYRREIGDAVGWLRSEYDGSQDYDLVLRVAEVTQNIEHLPYVLYHWRKTRGSTSESGFAKPYAIRAGLHALTDSTGRRALLSKVENIDFIPGHYKTTNGILDLNGTSLHIIVHLGQLTPEMDRLYSITYIQEDDDFTVVKVLAQIIKESSSDYVLFIHHPRSSAISNSKVGSLLSFAKRPGVGVVGVTVLNERGKIHSSGYCQVDKQLIAYGQNHNPNNIGYFGSLVDDRNVSSVGAELWVANRNRLLHAMNHMESLHYQEKYSIQAWLDLVCMFLFSQGLRTVVRSQVTFKPLNVYSEHYMDFKEILDYQGWSECRYGRITSAKEALEICPKIC